MMTFGEEVVRVMYQRGYRITDDGRLLSPKGNEIKGSVDARGYRKTTLQLRNCNYPVKFHRLAAYQKFGEQLFASGIETRHLNGDKTDNRLENIAIGTAHDNKMDMSLEDRQQMGRKTWRGRRPLSTRQVQSIVHDRQLGMSYDNLARKYGTNSGSVWQIMHGRAYTDITGFIMGGSSGGRAPL